LKGNDLNWIKANPINFSACNYCKLNKNCDKIDKPKILFVNTVMINSFFDFLAGFKHHPWKGGLQKQPKWYGVLFNHCLNTFNKFKQKK